MVPPPVVTTPKYPDFVRPAVPAELAGSAAAINTSRGWAFLQSGDLKTAEREFKAALQNNPKFLTAEASLGYLELARKDPNAALPHFDAVLAQQSHEVAALVGRGQALLSLERDREALAAFESALAVDPNQPDVRRRVDVLKFRDIEQDVQGARGAARAGRLDEAVSAYAAAIARQPESPFLYRELAAIERRQDKPADALEHLRKAADLDPGDAHSRVQIGEILEARQDFEGAIKAYSDAAAIEPNEEVDRKLEAAKSRAAFEKMPAEYRAIEQAPQITRADLAALIGIRLGSLLGGAGRPDAGLITDVRSNWAQPWIMSVARAGVMEPLPNHQFQPRALVRRVDLALAAARILAAIADRNPDAAKAWDASRVRFSDLLPSHLAFSAASTAVAAGVMSPAPDNSFQPSRPVAGADALSTIAKLESLAGLR
jgi:tetratricopeptide (TPR) repeat protein